VHSAINLVRRQKDGGLVFAVAGQPAWVRASTNARAWLARTKTTPVT